MKKFYLVLLLCVGHIAGVLAQTTFSGKVVSSNSEKGLVDAFVQLQNQYETVNMLTNSEGQFVFISVKPGNYVLSIDHVGFKKYEEPVEVKEGVAPKVIKLIPENLFLDAAIISSVRAQSSAPITFTNIDAKQIEQADQSKDFPFLLNTTPSTVISSDAGNGVGYTGVRIRGIDPTRVNVTINGIPLNDAESQGVYWVNLPDLSSSSQSVQVQRGLGGSTNGAASFGASVNIRTNDLDSVRRTTAVLGTGSFNTNRLSVTHNSGKLKNDWGYQIRGSIIESDGFIDRASSDLKSLNFIASKYWKDASLKANILLGEERTYQAWWGIPQPKFDGNISETNRYINQLWITGDDLTNLQNSPSNTYNYYTYENEVDNYNQNHYQFFYDLKLNETWRLSSAYYVTTGKGYFEQFRAGETLSDYDSLQYIIAGDTINEADLIRRRWLDNKLTGLLGSLNFKTDVIEGSLGGGFSTYDSRHFGEAIATEYTGYEEINALYYDNDSRKFDGNVYAKATAKFGNIYPYLDIQFRTIDYRFEGLDNSLEFGNQQVTYEFLNPKIGVSYIQNRHKFYAFAARGNREPVRDDFRNNKPNDWPKHEELDNVEVGYRYSKRRKQLGINVYQMNYRNQLVLTGAVNDVGEAIRTNVANSFRQGIEFEAQWPVTQKLQIGGNLTLSNNEIDSFIEYVGEWDGAYGTIEKKYNNTAISFSPSVIGMVVVGYQVNKQVSMNLTTKHVGKQYLDNTESDLRSLDAFTVADYSLTYSSSKISGLENLIIGLYLNNLLNARYAPNGYTYSGYIGGERQDFNYIYPMAGRNVMVKAILKIR